MSKKYFWEQQEWLDRIKKINPDFYNIIKNAKNIEMDFDTFSLIIDGVKYELTITDGVSTASRIIVTDENGKKTIFLKSNINQHREPLDQKGT